jgi:hypothetical protein
MVCGDRAPEGRVFAQHAERSKWADPPLPILIFNID